VIACKIDVKTLIQACTLCCLDYCNSFSAASRMVWWVHCSLFRIQLHAYCQALDAMTT